MTFARLVSPLIAAAVLMSALPAGAADDAAALLAKHKAYMGWSFGDGTFKSMMLEGTVSSVDTKKPVGKLLSHQVGLIHRLDVSEDETGLSASTGFTGRAFWQTNENRFVTKIIGDTAKARVARNLVFDEATTQLVGKSEGSSTIDGTTYDIVRVGIDASWPIDLYINPSTGAYKRAIIDPDGAYRVTYDITGTIDALPGKRIISGWNVGGRSFQITKVTPNADIADADLEPPKPEAKWTFGSGNPIPIKVTSRRIYINATVNGVEGHFVFDTGASGIALSEDFANRANLQVVKTQTVAGIGNKTSKSTVRRAPTFVIGDNTLSNVIVHTIDSQVLRNEDDGKDGLVGFDLLAGALVALSLDDSNISLFDPAQNQPDPAKAGAQVVVDLSTNHVGVPMKLNDKINVRAILDTGNSYYVIFGDELVYKDKLSFLVDRSRIASQLALGGVSGTITADCGQLSSLQLGPFNYQTPPGCMTHGSLAIGDRGVLVGFDFLKHFNYLFDYPEALIYLTTRKNDPP